MSDLQINVGTGRQAARYVAALVLALVIAGVLDVGVGLAYGVPAEYGMFTSGDTMADIARDALIMGALLGLVAAGLLVVVFRLLDRRHLRPLVLIAVVVVAAVATGAAGVAGRRHHDERVAQLSTAHTPPGIAALADVAQRTSLGRPPSWQATAVLG